MKTTEKPLFSNSSDFMSWTARNCDRCYKHVEPDDDSPIGWRCAIDADIQGQVCGLMEINQRSFDIVRGGDCPPQGNPPRSQEAPPDQRSGIDGLHRARHGHCSQPMSSLP